MTRPDKRRTPRIDVRQRLNGYIVSIDRPAVVLDISLGGFSVETEDEVPDGVHIVRLREGDRWSVTVTAASRHRRTKGGDAGRRHITGFEYADQNPDTQQTIRVLFERLAAEETVE
jgi:hypothetical protein